MSWIVIPNWERFQHYGDRDPVWIKVYTELMSRDEWCSLTDANKGVLTCVWLEYARSRGVLSVDRMLTLMHRNSRSSALESLSQAGFLKIVASKPSRARVREEKEKRREEKERVRVPAHEDQHPLKKRKNARQQAEAWIDNGLADQVPPEHLAEVMADEFGITDHNLLNVLVSKAKLKGMP